MEETMKKKRHFFIVEDDPFYINLLETILKEDGQRVSTSSSSTDALQKIIEQKPDCVLLDIMMPGIDGLELLKRIRLEPDLKNIKTVIISSKLYEFDQKRAMEFGADFYITKPVDLTTFLQDVERIIEDKIKVNFWGVRGTLPVSGEKTLKYGGNTSCISVEFAKGILFIFDAGTGIKVFSDHLIAEERSHIKANIFISHPHWDHINALPFFMPLYQQGNEFEICGASHGDVTMRELVSGQMDGVYFPVKMKEFSARVYFRNLTEETFEINGIKIQTMLLNHPGHCLGYRLEYKGRSICYVTDNEVYPKSSPFNDEAYYNKLKSFIAHTDALISDCTFNDSEYEKKIGWGHSSVGPLAVLAHEAKVKTLYLIHHDPNQTDIEIDAKLETAQAILKDLKSPTQCVIPKEKQCVRL